MSLKHCQPSDEVWSASESGTVCDETSGNQPAHPHERGFHGSNDPHPGEKAGVQNDDPSEAGEER